MIALILNATKHRSLTLSIVAVLLVLVGIEVPVAREIPALPEIPTVVAEAHPGFVKRRAALVEERAALRDRTQQHNAACSRVEEGSAAEAQCTQSLDTLKADLARHIQASKQFIELLAANGRRTSKDCRETEQQLARDQEAMHRQQKSIAQGQAELLEWTEKNDKAQKAALKRATAFLVDSLASKLGEFTEGKLAKLEADFRKRAPLGETWQRKIQKIQEFRAAGARLTGAVDGIKLAGFTGAAADGWREGKEWAAKNGKDAETLDAILAEWQRDPELQQIMKESGLSTFSAGLGFSKTLAPWGTTLDFGQFLVGYGYDATNWTLSKKRIEQQIANRDQDLEAVEALKKQIERTVAKLKACKGE